jgi:hypothetical protein
MKIIKTFIKIVHTRYIFFLYHERKQKISRDILRAVLRPARPKGVSTCHGLCLDQRKYLMSVSTRPDVPHVPRGHDLRWHKAQEGRAVVGGVGKRQY